MTQESGFAVVFMWLSSEQAVAENGKALRASINDDALVVDLASDTAPIYVEAVLFCRGGRIAPRRGRH